jgi:hypothetical protein
MLHVHLHTKKKDFGNFKLFWIEMITCPKSQKVQLTEKYICPKFQLTEKFI